MNSLTNTEILKIINDVTQKHEQVKNELIELSYTYDKKMKELEQLENEYIELIAELTNRTEGNAIREKTSS